MKNLKVRNKLNLILLCMAVMILTAGICAIKGLNDVRNHADEVLEEAVRVDYDESIKEEVENAISVLDQYNAKYEAGEYSLEEAEKLAADMLREMRYGEDGYFWADDTEGNNIVLLGSATEGTNRMETVDGNGYQMVKNIIAVGQEEGGGYSDYVFPKAGETENSPKRSYSKLYKPFGWVIGTGNYTDSLDEQVKAESAEVNKIVRKWISAMCAVVVIFFALTVILTICVIKDITSSLKRVVAFVEKLETGDMTGRASKRQLARKDEFGTLARAMNNLSSTFDHVISDVKNSSFILTNGVGDSVENIDLLNGEIEGVSATTEELSASMQETAAAAQQIATMSHEIETVSKSIAVRSQEGAEKAVSIHERAAKAKDETEQNQQKAKTIQSEISVRLKQALEDAKVVDQIELLAESIMEITAQTNLLALNASIEAARAGEAGKGFAVVADEIRNLAEQSKTTVENIQQVTQEVTGAVSQLSEDSGKLLEYVSEDVTENFDSFRTVASAYNEDAAYVDELVTDFSAISEELLASIDGVLESIESVSRSANEGATGTSDIAVKAANVAEKSSQVLDVIKNAGSTAEVLKEKVSKFIVNEHE